MSAGCFGIAVVCAIGLSGPPAADACGFGMVQQSPDDELRLVRDMSVALEEGRTVRALTKLSRFYRRAGPVEEGGNLAIRNRGLRLLARTLVESGVRGYSALGGDSREGRVSYAVEQLEALSEANPDDPQILTDLGVALAATETGTAQARDILEDLAKRDLMTSAQGWAALANLRIDAAGKSRAAQRCRLMTTRGGALCGDLVRPSRPLRDAS